MVRANSNPQGNKNIVPDEQDDQNLSTIFSHLYIDDESNV